MKKFILCISFILFQTFLRADDKIIISNNLNDFVPQGWQIIANATGDLNYDGINDTVVVIQNNELEVEYGTNSRELLILFSEDNKFRLIKSNDSLIPFFPRDDSCLIDPFEDKAINIDNNVLEIYFNYFYSCGSWYTSNYTYKLRYKNNDFRLIGLDVSNMHRATGDYEENSINLITNKIKTIRGNISNNKVKTTWSKTANNGILTLSNIGVILERSSLLEYLSTSQD